MWLLVVTMCNVTPCQIAPYGLDVKGKLFTQESCRDAGAAYVAKNSRENYPYTYACYQDVRK